jgi:F-type H+-transporting ATPase subunit epsilon
MAEGKFLQLTISRVDGPIFDGRVLFVTVPGIAGEMTLLSEHTPLISPLKAGTLHYKKEDGTQESHDITSGTLEVSGNHATILI